MEEPKVGQKYIEFIDDLVEQISPLLPKDVNKLQEKYLTGNIRHSAILLASSMETDEVYKSLDFENQCMYIQILAEWSFHKEIDLFRSGIPARYWKIVMQKIWYTMWEVMYACIQNDAPEDVILKLVEKYVNRTYQDAVEELKDSNIIDEETEEHAKEQSNIDIMAKEYQRQSRSKRIKQTILNSLRLTTLTLGVSAVVTFLILEYKLIGIIIVLSVLTAYNVISIERKK